ncbi:MAG: outer membrane beta-barrel protein [Bacteroidales bacterium]|nr:outer membrane beta-barrel protein [Bacteroidales bacterium]
MKSLFAAIFSLFMFLPCFSQEERNISFNLRLGAAFGGSKPSMYRDSEEANLLISLMAGVGVSLFINNDWEINTGVNYLRKGTNTLLNAAPELTTNYSSIFSTQKEDRLIYGWFNNGYLEIPLTFGYMWGYDSFITRVGGYFAVRTNTKADLIIGNQVISRSDNVPLFDSEIYGANLSKYDAGLKVVNEFFMKNFGFGLEFSTGFIPVAKKNWQTKSRTYNMAVAIFASFRF